MTKAKSSPLPTKRQIIDFIRESPVPVGKREIARAFRITGTDRVALKVILQELRQDGEIERGRGRRVAPPNTLPDPLAGCGGPRKCRGAVRRSRWAPFRR